MPDLTFAVEKAEPVPDGMAPLLAFQLRIACAAPMPIQTIALRCQVRIEPARRRYQAPEQDKLVELFGPPELWSRSLRSMLWTHASVIVPSFIGNAVVNLPVPCSFDFNVAATKYFNALEDGEVPLSLLFNGTIFHEGREGRLQAAPIPWDREAAFRLPVRVWKEMMDRYYPNSAWLCLRRDVFERLAHYKSRQALPSWEQALEGLLTAAERGKP